jgi:aromatic ring-opening dioxygenase LigB subunit
MLSFASITPHPPIIIPTIGSEKDLKEVRKTIEGMEKLREEMKKAKPETLILISPHGPVGFKEMTLTQTQKLSGDFSNFGDSTSQFSFENDKEVCEKIKGACREQNIPLRIYNKEELDHGALVPLYYLAQSASRNRRETKTRNYAKSFKIVPIAYSLLDNSWHFLFGKVLGKIVKDSKKKIGIVASGDLSHRLTPYAPAGFSPRGKEFDEEIIKFLKEKNTNKILNMDERLIEEAGECGYKSIIILLGALDDLDWQPKILSYEGPFGVGYLVSYFSVA